MAFGVCDGVGELSDSQWRIAGFDCRGFGEDILRQDKQEEQYTKTICLGSYYHTPTRCAV